MAHRKKAVDWATAQAHLAGKAKPPGSLGLLETWAAKLCVLQSTLKPSINRGVALIFAADHGVAKEEKVSAYPPALTEAIFSTLAAGGGAASVLAKSQGVEMEVIDVGIDADVRDVTSLVPVGSGITVELCKVASGTQNFCKRPAMTPEQCAQAMEVGRQAVRRKIPADLRTEHGRSITAIVIGELGIGNTTASSTLLCAFRSCFPNDAVGRGTGVDDEGLTHKIQVVSNALQHHAAVVDALQPVLLRRPPHPCAVQPEDAAIIQAVLAALGGLEIAAMVGAILQAEEQGAAVIIDGFICTVAALVATSIAPSCQRCLFLATQSPERGYRLAAAPLLGAPTSHDEAAVQLHPEQPLFDIGLRLGEGTGAILAYNILRAAAAIATEMWTLQDAEQALSR